VPSELNNVALVLIVFLLGIGAAAAVALLIRWALLSSLLTLLSLPPHLISAVPRKRLEMVALERDREQGGGGGERAKTKKETQADHGAAAAEARAGEGDGDDSEEGQQPEKKQVHLSVWSCLLSLSPLNLPPLSNRLLCREASSPPRSIKDFNTVSQSADSQSKFSQRQEPGEERPQKAEEGEW
jgi:hypothetical protein